MRPLRIGDVVKMKGAQHVGRLVRIGDGWVEVAWKPHGVVGRTAIDFLERPDVVTLLGALTWEDSPSTSSVGDPPGGGT